MVEELILLECVADLALDSDRLLGIEYLGSVSQDADAVTDLLVLDFVHCSIGKGKDVIYDSGIIGAYSIAVACRHVVIAVVYGHLLLEFCLVCFDGLFNGVERIVVADDENELVAAVPCHEFRCLGRGVVREFSPPARHLDEYGITCGMSHRIVDGLEVIEVCGD